MKISILFFDCGLVSPFLVSFIVFNIYLFVDNWGKKAIRRRTTGSGRTTHLKVVQSQYAGIRKTQNTYKAAVARAAKKNANNLA